MMKEFLLMLMVSALVPTVSAQSGDCPFGEVEDEFPGKCGLYTDKDCDEVCDRSEPTTGEADPRSRKDDASLSQDSGIGSPGPLLASIPSKAIVIMTPSVRYSFHEISLVMLVLFTVTEILVKKGKVRLLTARYFWNAVLALSFLACAATIIPYMYRWNVGFDYIWWHVEAGIVMIWICVYHIYTYGRFFTRANPFRKKA
ncbi:hypothetical protein ACFLRF_02995 [Candidatus Altiarchaeota archaeon]